MAGLPLPAFSPFHNSMTSIINSDAALALSLSLSPSSPQNPSTCLMDILIDSIRVQIQFITFTQPPLQSPGSTPMPVFYSFSILQGLRCLIPIHNLYRVTSHVLKAWKTSPTNLYLISYCHMSCWFTVGFLMSFHLPHCLDNCRWLVSSCLNFIL